MQGLTSEQVQERVVQGLTNDSVNDISKSQAQIVKEHVFTYFNFLNLCLAALIISTGKFENMAFLGVVFANTAMGIIQEMKVKKTIDALAIVTAVTCHVFRDASLVHIPVDQIVLDDVMLLNAGDQIPVDAKVLETSFLEVNEALLTGESEAVRKEVGDDLLGGSFVLAGRCYAEATRVGNQSYASTLIAKAKHANRAASQMRDTIEKVIKVISIIIIPVGLFLFQAQLKVYNGDVSWAIVRTVGGVVGMIPEGLVLLTSLSFVLGVGRLAGKRALVQQKESIEALSRVDVLCLDKTGTITTGELEVTEIVPMGGCTLSHIRQTMKMMLDDDTDNATQRCLRRYFGSSEKACCLARMPFSSTRKYQAVMADDYTCHVLGAPDYLCEDPELLAAVERYAGEGLRVLLLGKAKQNADVLAEITAVIPEALIIIKDVIKEDAYETLQYLRQEGIEIIVLSGDHPVTISRVCCLAGVAGYQEYVDASLLEKTAFDDPQVVDRYHIFGRVKPEQKLRIIKTLQAEGHIVGMIGDGVNDVLAIKDADCGIAMANGADAARQAAHIILTDSCFSSLIDIIKEGRAIIANIESVSSLYLNKTIYSSLLCLIFGLFALSYPFAPVQLTILGAYAIGVPSFFLTIVRSHHLNEEGFLAHLVKTALPCAMTIVIMVTCLTAFTHELGLTPMQLTTYAYIVTAFSSFCVLYLVCRPLDRLKTVLVVLMFSGFIVTVVCLHTMLGIQMRFVSDVFVLGLLCFVTFIVICIMMFLMTAGLHYERRKE